MSAPDPALAGLAHDLVERARKVRLAVFDVDGVMTDGRLYLTDSGEEMKAFHSRDGHGMKMLKATGVEVAIITGRTSRVVDARARNLGVAHLFQGVEDKLEVWRELLGNLGLAPEQTSYMGDDVVDLPVMIRCGFAVTVPDAARHVVGRAHHVTRAAAGAGAVRECCEIIMAAQGTLEGHAAGWFA